MKYRNSILSIGAALLLGVAALFAQGMHGRGGHGGFDFDHLLGFYSDYLDLSTAQQDQAKAIWAKEKSSLEPLMQQMHQNHQAMHALEATGTFDEAKTRALATQNAQTMIELQVQHARIKNELTQILTPDQKTKLQQFEAKREARMKDHMGAPPED
jgi:periplasmic protein CpxP/Spy